MVKFSTNPIVQGDYFTLSQIHSEEKSALFVFSTLGRHLRKVDGSIISPFFLSLNHILKISSNREFIFCPHISSEVVSIKVLDFPSHSQSREWLNLRSQELECFDYYTSLFLLLNERKRALAHIASANSAKYKSLGTPHS